MPFPLPKSYNFYSNFVFALVATRIEMTWGVEAWIISKIFYHRVNPYFHSTNRLVF